MIKNQMNQFKRLLLRLVKNQRIPKYYKKLEDINISPIFILGAARSGTSMITSVIAQHPDVEGIFPVESDSTINNMINVSTKHGHIKPYCNSHHVWNDIFDNSLHVMGTNEGILYGHPKHISKHYRDKSKNEKESLRLANSIEYFRRTNKIPLINSHFNMLRIGLIKQVFPKAKFILIIRDFKDHFKGWRDKVKKKYPNILPIHVVKDYPKIGLYWTTLNSCTIYDLNKYSEGDYCIIDYASLFEDNESVKEMLNRKINNIGLCNFQFNVDYIDRNLVHDKGKHIHSISNYFDYVNEIFTFEKKEIQ